MLPRAPVNIPFKEGIEQFLMVFLADSRLIQIPNHTYFNDRLVVNKHEVIKTYLKISVLTKSRMPIPPSARSRYKFLQINFRFI
jgi:hypothetical protein